MKKILVFLLLTACLPKANAEILVLGRTSDCTPAYQWVLSLEPPLRLPKWEKGKEPPLSPGEAERRALAWVHKQPLAGELPERPFQITLTKLPAPYDHDYIYKVTYGMKQDKISFWTVFLLMDGTLIEPTPSPAGVK
jgi:hypothetical protein